MKRIYTDEERKERDAARMRERRATECGKIALAAYNALPSTKERKLAWAKANRLTPEYRLASSARYQANKDAIVATFKAFDAAHPEKLRERSLRHYYKHRDRIYPPKPDSRVAMDRPVKYNRAHYLANKEKIIARHRRNIKARKEADPAYRAMESCRCRLYNGVRRQRATKCANSTALIGCTWDELKAHLEAQFLPGMTWENHGRHGWHIDHIRPCAAFDFSDPKQQRACFHFTNLQPLWWADNFSKGGKYHQ